MSNWSDNTPDKGVLCRDDFGSLINIIELDDDMLIDDTGTAHDFFRVTRLTPQEFWSLAPWNYDISAAPTEKQILIKRKNGNVTKAFLLPISGLFDQQLMGFLSKLNKISHGYHYRSISDYEFL